MRKVESPDGAFALDDLISGRYVLSAPAEGTPPSQSAGVDVERGRVTAHGSRPRPPRPRARPVSGKLDDSADFNIRRASPVFCFRVVDTRFERRGVARRRMPEPRGARSSGRRHRIGGLHDPKSRSCRSRFAFVLCLRGAARVPRRGPRGCAWGAGDGVGRAGPLARTTVGRRPRGAEPDQRTPRASVADARRPRRPSRPCVRRRRVARSQPRGPHRVGRGFHEGRLNTCSIHVLLMLCS